jgi:flagellar motor switch protein FliN/FliY
MTTDIVSNGTTPGRSYEVTHLLDVPLKVTIELGRRSMKVREILHLAQSSIVEFPKSAGESMDIFINGKLIGTGEVVELEGNAGIRLTDFVVNS